MENFDLIEKANEVYLRNFKAETWFERAVFLSWYCSRGDCKFCYMSTQKDRIKNPRLAKRNLSSILAEVFLCKKLGWQIEFLSCGYEALNFKELINVVKNVKRVYGDKLWLNVGVLGRKELEELRPYVKGVCGSVETVNMRLRKRLCPSKPINEILEMFYNARGFEKAVTIIIGLGETLDDIENLFNFIEENNITKVTFYALKPQRDTIFKKGPDSLYYANWIANTRIKFPKIKIVAGTWVNRVAEVSLLLKAGANAITKFPSIRLFGSEQAKVIEEEAKVAGREFKGTLTDINYLKKIEIEDSLKEDSIKGKLQQYIEVMRRSKN